MAVPSLMLVSMSVPSSERVALAKNWCLKTRDPKKLLEMRQLYENDDECRTETHKKKVDHMKPVFFPVKVGDFASAD